MALLSARGAPPSAIEFLIRTSRIDELRRLNEVWERFQEWFAEIEETHVAGALVFFRSPKRSLLGDGVGRRDGRSCAFELDDRHPVVTTGGAMCARRLFGAARDRRLLQHSYDPDPQQTDRTSIAREEFDDACRQLAEAGVPLKPDLDQAWIDFNGWRVNYDSVLIHLAALTEAPYGMWSSDRSLTGFRLPPLLRRRRSAGS